ncbi:hypothetical protein [Insulibacter thermoxylanivorax]|uniref:hypothetical protein n=1 Tax=Insulibacter thermoxylanivorax TaxID=2749268 RepID=UPI0019101CD2|nr:hypothetical protein [Insulibacter thermoxylanivorax]
MEDLNLLSKAQVDQLPLEMEAVDLPALLAQIVDRLSKDAAARSMWRASQAKGLPSS